MHRDGVIKWCRALYTLCIRHTRLRWGGHNLETYLRFVLLLKDIYIYICISSLARLNDLMTIFYFFLPSERLFEAVADNRIYNYTAAGFNCKKIKLPNITLLGTSIVINYFV